MQYQQTAGAEALARNLDLAGNDVERALLGIGIERDRIARNNGRIGEERLPQGLDRGGLAKNAAAHDPNGGTVLADDRKRSDVVVRKARRAFLLRIRQRDPALEPMDGLAVASMLGGRALGMHNSAPGRHPVHFARTNGRGASEAVAMHDLAVEEIGDGCKPDMGMRPHVDPLTGAEFGRAEMIEEDEGSDHAPARVRQRAAHGEMAEIDAARHDHEIDGVGRRCVAGRRIFAGEEAHAG